MTGWIQTWLDRRGTPMPWTEVAITTVTIALPPLIAILMFGRIGAAAFMAALPAHLAARDRGLGLAFLAVSVTGIAGVAVLGKPELALIVGPVLGVMVAILGRYGYAAPLLAALITWTVFTAPFLPADKSTEVLCIYIVAMLSSLGMTRLFKRDGDPANRDAGEGRESREHVTAFAVVMALGMFISLWAGTAFFGKHGFWFPLTFVVLVMPPHGAVFRRTIQRTIGTILGTALALLGAWLSGSIWVALALGAIALPLAFRSKPWSYTAFTMFLTVVVLELLALTTSIGDLATERLVTMAAAAVTTFALGGLAALGLHLFRPAALQTLLKD